MSRMFYHAPNFNNGGQPLTFDTSSVTDMKYMFYQATSFDQDLCHWAAYYDGTEYTGYMFAGSGCPNQADPTPTAANWCAASC